MRANAGLRSILVVLIASVMMGAPSLAAQTLPPPDGITVLGQGQASVSADSSLIQFTVGAAMYMEPSVPQPGATPGAAELEAMQPVVDALVNAGVAEADITVVVPPFLGNAFSGPYGPASALVEVAVSDPTADRVVEIINVATMGAADSRMIIGEISAMHTVNDCAPLENEARQAAFDDARQQANVQADVIGVSLGDVEAARDYPFGPSLNNDPLMGFAADGSCTSAAMSGVYGPFGPMPYDITGEPEVTVYMATEFTFGIEDGMAATPTS